MTGFRFFIGIILLGFWFLLTNGDLYSVIVGIFFVPLSIYVSIVLSRHTDFLSEPVTIKFTKLPGFMIFFIVQSFKGGIDTAFRACSVSLNIKPEFIHYHIHNVPPGTAMNLFMNLISLLPGSVSVIREPKGVLVHVLAKTKTTVSELSACENAVCRLFGVEYVDHLTNNNKLKEPAV